MNEAKKQELGKRLFPQYWGDYALSSISDEGLEGVRQKKEIFAQHPPAVRPIPYWGERRFRQKFIHQRYGAYLKGRVLDVGCDEAALRSLVGSGYVGIDFQGNPDARVNLNQGELPFANQSFDAVVCTDVIEHIDNAHVLFDEIMRVARRWAIFSFPNCWWGKIGYYKRGIDPSRSYGIPPEPALDRHRWFFNCVQAEDFAAYRSAKNKARVISWEHFYARGDIFNCSLRLGSKDLSYPKNYPAPDGVNTLRRRLLKRFFWPFEAYERLGRLFCRIATAPETFRNHHVCVVWVVVEKSNVGKIE